MAALLIQTNTASAAPKKATKDQAMITADESKWKTHCIGRFLIDLPADAEYVGGNYEYGFVTVERQSMDRSAFEQEVNALETRLRESKSKDESLLLKKSAPNDDTRIFGFWLDHDQRVRVKIWGYRWLNGMRYLTRNSADPDKLDGAVMRQEAILSSLRTLETGAPTAKGFCVEQALIVDDGTSKHENLNIRFRMKNHPDVVLDVATNRNTSTPPEPLLSRKPSIFSGLGLLGATLGGISTLKEGERKIGDHPGEEWLLKAPNDHGQKAHLFTWEAPGLYRDPLHPQIRFDLQSGNFDGGLDPKPISLTDKQMLELWDKILNSLRLRPTDEGKGSPGERPTSRADSGAALPLGELARTGAPCPQTGYWQCPDRDVNGSPRLFQQGEIMPAAVIKRELSFMERLKGANAEVITNTVWRLVKYVEEKGSNFGPSLVPVSENPRSDS
jgi:hypothetical protein